MSRKHRKNARAVTPKSQELPLPGKTGAEILRKMLDGNISEALDQFYETYIGTIGDIPEIQVIEDDGNQILFVSKRGPFKLQGMGRKLLLDTLAAFKAQLAREMQQQKLIADLDDPVEATSE
jgi:hypothetical protein